MILTARRVVVATLAATAVAASMARTAGQTKPACDPDNGGLTLPSGFCALVVANNLGAARHLAIAPNGDLYVALQRGGGPGETATRGGVAALHDADGDGRFETTETFGDESTTGIALRNGYLYVAHPLDVQRYKMTVGQ